MNARRLAFLSVAARAAVAAAFVGSFLFTLLLSATPQLHERLHRISDTATHECAVTLVSSGNCDHVVTAMPCCEPLIARGAAKFTIPDATAFAQFRDFSLLEHAPPALS